MEPMYEQADADLVAAAGTKMMKEWLDEHMPEAEILACELLHGLTEIKPQKESLWEWIIKKEDPFLVDGADSSTISFDWETDNGIVTVNYNWKNDDPNMQELISLLKSLQNNTKGE